MAIGYKSNADGSGGAITSDAVPVVKINSDDSVSIVNDLIVENGTIVLDKASGGKTILKPSDDSLDVDNLTFPKKGLLVNEDRLAVNVPLSNITAYHLLEGNLSVSNTVSTNGFSTTLYTGNGSTQSINTGVDMDSQWGNDPSERFGGLVWCKSRSVAGSSNYLTDTIRGVSKSIYTDSTLAQVSEPIAINAISNTGFSIGSSLGVNTNLSTNVSWNFQTTHRRSGTTNHGMAYTEHYNPFTGFTMIQYTGSGIAGHEIPHHLGRKLGFCNIKCLTDGIEYWQTGISDKGYAINSTHAFVDYTGNWDFTDNAVTLKNSNVALNASANTYIMYGWANSYLDKSNKLIGNYEIGTYTGTGIAGNKVKTRGKPAWILVKGLDRTTHWRLFDNLRTDGTPEELYPNLSNAEVSSTILNINNDGFTWVTSNTTETNVLGDKYLYMVVYDNDSTSGKSKYPKAQDTSTLNINNAKIPFANGLSVNGTRITALLRNEVIPGLTLTPGKNYVYMKNDGTYGVNINKPNYNSFNGFGDYFDTVKNKWFKDVALLSDKCNNIGSWVGVNGTLTLSPSGNTLRITMTNTSYAPSASRQLTNLIVGKRYYVSAEKHTSSSIDGRIIVGSNPAGDEMLNTNTGVMSGTFIATATTGYVIIQCAGTAIGHYVEFNNVVCYPINIDGTLDTSNGTEITESRNYLDTIVYADHNGQVVYTEDVVKSKYERDLVITGSLSLTDVDNINSNKDIVYKINDVEKMRVREDGAILNQDGVALSSGGFKNILINGDFSIDQYGRGNQANFSNLKPYMDRWWVNNALFANNGQFIQAPKGFTNMLYVSKNNTHDTQIIQRVEIKKDTAIRTFNGRTFTFSFYVKSNVTNFIDTLYFIKNGVTVNSYEVFNFKILNNTIAGGWVRVVGTITASFVYDAGDYIEIRIDPTSSVAGEVYITGCQLEEGSVATPYEFRHPSLELMMCQRYYETHIPSGTSNTHGMSYNTFYIAEYSWKVRKRVIPTVTQVLGGGTLSGQQHDQDKAVWTFTNATSANFITQFTADAEL